MQKIFENKNEKPDKRTLKKALGPSYTYFETIKSQIEKTYGMMTEEWKYYSVSSGWTLKMLLKKRNLFFCTPCENYFRVSFVFGDKAVDAIAKSDLPSRIINELTTARRYMEGRGLRIEVKKKSDIPMIMKLVDFKLNPDAYPSRQEKKNDARY
jgi:hypothetical protein